jgi:hypothetical protein
MKNGTAQRFTTIFPVRALGAGHAAPTKKSCAGFQARRSFRGGPIQIAWKPGFYC